MSLVKIGKLAEVPPGTVTQVELGEETVAVCNAGGQLYAVDGICPHAGGPLGQGALHGTTLVCPWHAWEYNCVTGFNEADDGYRLATFPVTVEDGEIYVELP